MPLSAAPCYDGPPGTMNVGACVAGTATCAADGSAYGACTGQVLPTAESCASAADESCDGSPGCAGNCLWSKRFGGTMNEGFGLVTGDRLGNVILYGNAEGPVDFGGGPLAFPAGAMNAYFVKLDRAGAHLWSKPLSGTQWAAPQSMSVAPNGDLLIAGDFRGTLSLGGEVLATAATTQTFLLRLDPLGAVVWVKQLDTVKTMSVAADSAGNAIVAGSFTNALDLGGGTLLAAGGNDVYVGKLDPAGQHVWSKTFGSSADDTLLDVAVGPGDRVVIGGNLAGSATFGGPILGTGPYLASFTASGTHQWSRSVVSPQMRFVRADPQGNAYVLGMFSGPLDFGVGQPITSVHNGVTYSTDVFLLKVSPAGVLLSVKGFGGMFDEAVFGLEVDGAGQVVFSGTSGSGTDVPFVTKVDSAGQAIWSRAIGKRDLVPRIGLDPGGAVFVGAQLHGINGVDFGCGPLSSAGAGDAVAAKLSP